MNELDALTRDYRTAFLRCLPRREEAALTSAYELGRGAVTAGVSMLDLTRIHHRCWMIRPPRRLQELHQAARVIEPDLAQKLQRMPSTDEVVQHLGVDAGAVDDAREAGGGYYARSLDRPLADSGQLLCDTAPGPDDPFQMVDDVLSLRPALETLGTRERDVLRLRFVDNLTQEQIGHRIGVSQMQVSRLLTAILAKLRQSLENQRAA